MRNVGKNQKQTITTSMHLVLEKVQNFRGNVDPLSAIELFTFFVTEQQKRDGSLSNEEWDIVHGITDVLTTIARVDPHFYQSPLEIAS